MKHTNPFMTLCVASFALTFALSFAFIFMLFVCAANFVEIHLRLSLYESIMISLLLSLVNLLLVVHRKKKLKESKLGFWLNNNWPKLVLSYIIILLFLASVTKEVIWASNEINDVLTLEWTIFGLSLTIFLVWNVLIVEYLGKKRPADTETLDYWQKVKRLNEKRSFSQEVDATFLTVIILAINLFSLLLSSSLVFVIHKPESQITQNVLRFSFYFSTNTIASLFLDILKPLMEDKKRLKAGNQVTKEELDSAQVEAFLYDIVEAVVKTVYHKTDLSEDEKAKLKELFSDGIKDMLPENKSEGERNIKQKQVEKADTNNKNGKVNGT